MATQRLLVVIPNYYRAEGDDGHGSTAGLAKPRVAAFTQCVRALRTHFDSSQECWFRGAERHVVQAANSRRRLAMDIVVCTTGDDHLLDSVPLPRDAFRHHRTACEPRMLGFACHEVLRDGLGNYDLYAYLEDDLVLHDPSFFEKLAWLRNALGDDAVVQPNRYEAFLDGNEIKKVYIDLDLRTREEAASGEVHEVPWFGGRVRVQRAGNPHAGCFFLTDPQMRHWAAQKHFLDGNTSFIGPLESAATLGILRTFRVFKLAPENANILEIQHFGQVWSRRLPNVRV